MYEHHNIRNLLEWTEMAITEPVERHGVSIYVGTNPDDIAPDIYIDPADIDGIKIFREFAAKMAAHYKTLKK